MDSKSLISITYIISVIIFILIVYLLYKFIKKIIKKYKRKLNLTRFDMKKDLDENSVRVIKISKDALFEFIYENFIDKQELFLEVDSLDVIDSFDVDWENGQFIFCAHKSEDSKGNIITLPQEINLKKLLKNIPDTTSSMYNGKRYKEYTKEELIKMSEK
ncbi:MAG: hypothetical protein ACI3VR_14165 [Intestinibacter sp.]|uniref:hypothetical protein n=1 Tax=Intestinibacter sp. TaxID=1965304 RepID=UPI003F15250D